LSKTHRNPPLDVRPQRGREAVLLWCCPTVPEGRRQRQSETTKRRGGKPARACRSNQISERLSLTPDRWRIVRISVADHPA
jgi:hypothetical protein